MINVQLWGASGRAGRPWSGLADFLSLPIHTLIINFDFHHSQSSGIESNSIFGVRSIQPSRVAIIGIQSDGGWNELLVSLSDEEQAIPFLEKLFSQQHDLIFYDAKRAYHCLWKLGVFPSLGSFYDVKVAESCLTLGQNSFDSNSKCSRLISQWAMKKLQDTDQLSLDTLYRRYLGSGAKTFVNTGPDEIVEAYKILDICAQQRIAVLEQGLDDHLYGIEFPFIEPTAWMEWSGVRVSVNRLGSLRTLASAACDFYGAKLAKLGLDTPRSQPKFQAVLEGLGLLSCLEHYKDLRKFMHLHPAVEWFTEYQRFAKLADLWSGQKRKVFTYKGRVHPLHVQNGAATGRSALSMYPFGSLAKALRPLVVPSEGCGIAELDWSQMEVIVMAAEFGEQDLIDDYNQGGDVYAQIAAKFQAKNGHSDVPSAELREKFKRVFLSLCNGMGMRALAEELGCSHDQALQFHNDLLDLYPKLRDGLDRLEREGLANGYATIRSGLKRWPPKDPGDRGWLRRMYRNTPIQGGAALIFKVTMSWLHHDFKDTAIKIILTIHDSIIIEAPLDQLQYAIDRAKHVMEQAPSLVYAGLKLLAKVNSSDPSCWNHKGESTSFERFVTGSYQTMRNHGWQEPEKAELASVTNLNEQGDSMSK